MQGSGSAPSHHKREEKYSLHFLSISKGGTRANKAEKGGDLGQSGKEHFHELPACAGLLCSTQTMLSHLTSPFYSAWTQIFQIFTVSLIVEGHPMWKTPSNTEEIIFLSSDWLIGVCGHTYTCLTEETAWKYTQRCNSGLLSHKESVKWNTWLLCSGTINVWLYSRNGKMQRLKVTKIFVTFKF